MFITARLQHNETILQDTNIAWGTVYEVNSSQQDVVGTRIQVVAGPHADYNAQWVYTVKLLDPPLGTMLPFFNEEYRSGFGYSDVSVIVPVHPSSCVLGHQNPRV